MMYRSRYRLIATALAAVLAVGSAAAQPPDFGGMFFGPSAGAGGSYGTDLPDDVIVQYDAETGSLIVITDEETNAQLESVIEELDKPVPQVLINVLFLEVTHSNGLDLGTEFFLADIDTRNALTATQLDDGSISFGSETVTERESLVETLFDIAGESTGGFYRLIKDDVNVTLRALAENATLEVLSRPSILTRNNQQAVITVGQEVPFIRNTRILQDGQQLNTVEYEDIGIILEVTPHIRPDGLVEMQVIPEISTLTGETVPISTGVTAPVFAKRSAETGVIVPHGQTVVIGGLMSDQETTLTRKVPLLGDIPLLGHAFKRTVTDTEKTELLIFLTPYIIAEPGLLAEATERERGRAELTTQSIPRERIDRLTNMDPLAPSTDQPDLLEEAPAPDDEKPAPRRRNSMGRPR